MRFSKSDPFHGNVPKNPKNTPFFGGPKTPICIISTPKIDCTFFQSAKKSPKNRIFLSSPDWTPPTTRTGTVQKVTCGHPKKIEYFWLGGLLGGVFWRFLAKMGSGTISPIFGFFGFLGKSGFFGFFSVFLGFFGKIPIESKRELIAPFDEFWVFRNRIGKSSKSGNPRIRGSTKSKKGF